MACLRNFRYVLLCTLVLQSLSGFVLLALMIYHTTINSAKLSRSRSIENIYVVEGRILSDLPIRFWAELAKLSLQSCRNRPRTVVSLATFWGRLTRLQRCIDSLLQQSCRPDAIYVHISAVPRLADFQARVNDSRVDGSNSIGRSHGNRLVQSAADTEVITGISKNSIVKLNFISEGSDDYGPGTKLLATLNFERDPQTQIIVVDDDSIYRPDMVLRLVIAADILEQPAIGYSCQEFVFGKNMSLRYWPRGAEGSCHGALYGSLGALYQRRLFNETVFDFTNREACILHDDVYFGGHVMDQGFTPYVIGGPSTVSESHRQQLSSFVIVQDIMRKSGRDLHSECGASFSSGNPSNYGWLVGT